MSVLRPGLFCSSDYDDTPERVVCCLTGIVTSALVSLMGQARIYMALARERLLPPWLAVIDAKRSTPINATVLTAVTAGDSPEALRKPLNTICGFLSRSRRWRSFAS